MTLKKTKKLFVLSDGSSYSEFIISLRNNSNYILLNQDINNHSFWVDNNKTFNNFEKLNTFNSYDTNINIK
jgi:ribosomal protein L31